VIWIEALSVVLLHRNSEQRTQNYKERNLTQPYPLATWFSYFRFAQTKN